MNGYFPFGFIIADNDATVSTNEATQITEIYY